MVETIRTPQVTDALRVSLISSTGALIVCLVLGVPLAYVLARVEFPGRALVRSLVLVPMVLPPVVGGVALLLAFGPRGILGDELDTLGITLPFTTAATVVAASYVALPFLVLALEAGFESVDQRHEEVAATLGGSPWYVFRTVTLPIVRPALISGATLAWARALGEFGATITFAGSIAGVTQTMPLAVYQVLPINPDAALTLSIVLLVISTTIIVSLRSRWLTPLRARLTA
jgi:molybdate transport system permease protein